MSEFDIGEIVRVVAVVAGVIPLCCFNQTV